VASVATDFQTKSDISGRKKRSSNKRGLTTLYN